MILTQHNCEVSFGFVPVLLRISGLGDVVLIRSRRFAAQPPDLLFRNLLASAVSSVFPVTCFPRARSGTTLLLPGCSVNAAYVAIHTWCVSVFVIGG